MKWAELAKNPSELRFKLLSEFLNKSGFENEVSFLSCDLDTFAEVLKKAKTEFSQFRIGAPFGGKVFDFVESMPMAALTQKSADSLVHLQGAWWARSMLCEGLVREVALVKKLDISETAFIIGAGSSCRAVVAALMRLGFKKYNITEKFEDRGRDLVTELKKTYFGVDFRFTPQSGITQLPGIHSLLINTTPFEASNDLLRELYYCNFLKPEGLAIDLTLVPYETPLLKAVAQVGGRVVHGSEVAGLVDVYWAKVAFDLDLDAKEYLALLAEKCKAEPFDLSKFEIPEF